MARNWRNTSKLAANNTSGNQQRKLRLPAKGLVKMQNRKTRLQPAPDKPATAKRHCAFQANDSAEKAPIISAAWSP